MKRLPLLLTITLLLMAASSCFHDANIVEALDRADLLMEDAPDSALTTLETIDSVTIARDHSLYPRYALLITQARYKNFIEETSDSLISIALDHYAGTTTPEEIKVNYYTGTINLYTQNYEKALRHGLTAHDLAQQLVDTLWIARSSELIADIFHLNHLHDEAIAYSTIARDCYRAIGKTNNELTACIDIAIYNYNLGLYKKSQLQLDSIQAEALNKGQLNLIGSCYKSLLPAYLKQNKPYDALSAFDKYLSIEDDIIPAQAYIYASNAWLDLGFVDKCYEMLDSASNKGLNLNDSILFLEIQAQAHFKDKKYELAYLKMKECAYADDDNATALLKQSALRTQNEYNNVVARRAHNTATFKNNVLLIIVLFLLVLFVSIFVYTKHRRKKIISNLESQIAEIKNLYEDGLSTYKRNAKQQEIHKTELNAKMHKLLTNRFAIINSLCTQYWEDSETPVDSMLLVKQFEKELNALKSNDNISSISQIVNESLDNILEKLKIDVPTLKDDEITLVSLIYAGLSSRLICILLKLKIATFYTKRNRIKKKIAQIESENANHYLRYF